MISNYPILRLSRAPEAAARFAVHADQVAGLAGPTSGLVRVQFSPRPVNGRRVLRRGQYADATGARPGAEIRDYSLRRGTGLAGSRLATAA
jgi:hypothetical protein